MLGLLYLILSFNYGVRYQKASKSKQKRVGSKFWGNYQPMYNPLLFNEKNTIFDIFIHSKTVWLIFFVKFLPLCSCLVNKTIRLQNDTQAPEFRIFICPYTSIWKSSKLEPVNYFLTDFLFTDIFEAQNTMVLKLTPVTKQVFLNPKCQKW